MTFHHTRFPTAISLGSVVARQRRTEIVTLGSGHEERNSRWADSRRSYNAGYGIHTLDDLHRVLDFFEERRGRLYGFLWKDALDHKSCLPSKNPLATDQVLATGDGQTAQFQLTKTYGQNYAPWAREVAKPVLGSVLVAVAGQLVTENVDYQLDYETGKLAFVSGQIPLDGQIVSAGFGFDVPVRFDTDRLEMNMAHFKAGQIPDIPVVELRI